MTVPSRLSLKRGTPKSTGRTKKAETAECLLKTTRLRKSDFSTLSEDSISNFGVGIYIVQDGKFSYVSPLFQKLCGYSGADLIDTNPLDYISPDYREITRQQAITRLKGQRSDAYEYKITRKDGKEIWTLETITSIFYKGRRAALGTFMDITERKLMEESIRLSEERYRTIIDEMEEWYFEADINGNITFFNDNFARAVEHSQKDITGMNFQNLINPADIDAIYRLFHEIFKTGKSTKNFLYEFISPDGVVTSAEFSVFPKRDLADRVCGFRGVGHDITERKRTEERIQYLATHDSLTGLPNRLMFNQLLHHAIETAKRYKRQFAVLFIDLDRFKTINDSMGHEAGDQLLQEIAKRLTQTLRAVDVVARLGGDEFVILIEELSEPDQVKTVAGKILSAVMKPVYIAGNECRVTTSIGVSIYPQDADNEQALMKNADIAMYFAKEEGKNNVQFYSEEIQSRSLEHLSIETNLRYALERDEFSLHYQAKVDFKTNAITGVEALIRWQSPSLGSVTPTQFIPVAEETGLIIPIGNWVIRTACAQNAAWQREGLPPVCMAVNLSLRQLTDIHLIDDIRAALADSGMDPELLELEITESMVMHNPVKVIAVLHEIKNLGVRLAIDDFGTGFSSLAQIKNFPVDTLKVDRSFIRNLPEDLEDKAITEAIIAMGKSLCLNVVAEGVETIEQEDFLREHFCDEMQGYFFSKPVSHEKFADLLRQHIPVAVK
ncbi:MAG: EAL domain-containing protein [Smithellaceae bacterium]